MESSKIDVSAGKVSTALLEFIESNELDIPKLIVDIGANRGGYQSNSQFFLEHGWSGVLIEPVPRTFNILVERFSRFGDNVRFLNIALSDHSEYTNIYRHRNDSDRTADGGASLVKTSNSTDKKWWTLAVESKAIALALGEVGVLSVDTEGYDNKILKNWLESGNLPKFIISEDMSDWSQEEEKAKIKMLTEVYGYSILIDRIGGNQVYYIK